LQPSPIPSQVCLSRGKPGCVGYFQHQATPARIRVLPGRSSPCPLALVGSTSNGWPKFVCTVRLASILACVPHDSSARLSGKSNLYLCRVRSHKHTEHLRLAMQTLSRRLPPSWDLRSWYVAGGSAAGRRTRRSWLQASSQTFALPFPCLSSGYNRVMIDRPGEDDHIVTLSTTPLLA